MESHHDLELSKRLRREARWAAAAAAVGAAAEEYTDPQIRLTNSGANDS
jgi:hypothetical protein